MPQIMRREINRFVVGKFGVGLFGDPFDDVGDILDCDSPGLSNSGGSR